MNKELKEFDSLIYHLAMTHTEISKEKMERYRELRQKYPDHHYGGPL